ncbi:hypothetical protein ACN27G_25780 [Plantactinospora sp. WMMB334]|uniref:hypothetical protein n=1 Tax=Plantactinospora sp. WMMB334 TaxID=3404119 RepID=UPI003B9561F1
MSATSGAGPAAGPAPAAVSTGAGGALPTGLRTAAPGVPSAPAAAYPGMPGPVGGPGAAGGGLPARVPAPPRESLRAPTRVAPVPGTPFGLVYLDVAPVTSGPAVTSLVAGSGSVLVAFVAGCLGLLGSPDWGGWVAGAFAVLAGVLGLAGLLLGELGRRQTGPARLPSWFSRRAAGDTGPGGAAPPVRFTGRGLAIAGITCSAVGLAVTVLALAVAVLLQLV